MAAGSSKEGQRQTGIARVLARTCGAIRTRCINLLVEHTKQPTSLDEANTAEAMTTAELVRESNRMRVGKGDHSVSPPAAASENQDLPDL